MEIQEIKKLVEQHTGIRIDKKSRKSSNVFAKYCYYYLAYEYGLGIINHSVIAETVPYDRCTVLHGINTFDSLINHNAKNHALFRKIELEVLDGYKKISDIIYPIESDKMRLRRMYRDLCYKYKRLKQDYEKVKTVYENEKKCI